MNTSLTHILYQYGLWISAPLFCIAALMLGFFILNIVKLEKQSRILNLPLLEQQSIEFGDAGQVIMCLKRPQFNTRFPKLNYELSAEDGTRVKSRALWFRPTSSGISTVTTGIGLYNIPWSGKYILRIQGLKADQSSYAKC
jgi:hypothetical protein